jgi:hypothetical protein
MIWVPTLLIVLLIRAVVSTKSRTASNEASTKAQATRSLPRPSEERIQEFLKQTKLYVRHSPKHPVAALYREACKRAVALCVIHDNSGSQELSQYYEALTAVLSARYREVAPHGLYGQVRLKITPDSVKKWVEQELQRMTPKTRPSPKDPALACIYAGEDGDGRFYIGQTVEAPELRWKQHRTEGTGPFKSGAKYAEWKVLRGGVPPEELDNLESYFIGLFNAFETGHNDTRGNDAGAYERGCVERKNQTQS